MEKTILFGAGDGTRKKSSTPISVETGLNVTDRTVSAYQRSRFSQVGVFLVLDLLMVGIP